MNNTLWTYVAYLAVCLGITVWVARTLRRNGLILLTSGRSGDQVLSEAYSHLLIVGFYLISFGVISYFLKTETPIASPESIIEVASAKVGTILVVLGAMHFLTLASLASKRKQDDETLRYAKNLD